MNWNSIDVKCTYSQGSIQVATIIGVKCVIASLFNIVVPLIILAATAMIIYAGAKIIMGGDNPKEYQAGMQTLTYAVIGLVGLGLAWIILLLIKAFTGADIFTLPF